MLTHTWKLPSGVECEVNEYTGKHQRILTEQKNKKQGENFNEMLADVLVRVGNDHGPFDKDYVKAMLAADRKSIMVETRQFTLGSEPVEGETSDDNVFKFTYNYVDSEGKKASIEHEVDLEDGNFPTTPYKLQWENYSEINKDVHFTLPDGSECVWKMMDGFSEEVGAMTKKTDRSSHTPLIMRNVRTLEWNGDKTKKIPIQANFDKWSIRNIEALRTNIRETEGRVDTEERFEHPEADLLGPNEKFVVVDLVSLPAFFFPSQAI